MRAHQQKGGGLAGDMLFYPFGQEWQYDNGVNSAWWQFYNSFSRWSADLGFDLTPNRKYSPALGRWMTPDPSGMAAASPSNPQTWNMYAYALNNPTSLIDTSGLQSGCPDSSGSADKNWCHQKPLINMTVWGMAIYSFSVTSTAFSGPPLDIGSLNQLAAFSAANEMNGPVTTAVGGAFGGGRAARPDLGPQMPNPKSVTNCLDQTAKKAGAPLAFDAAGVLAGSVPGGDAAVAIAQSTVSLGSAIYSGVHHDKTGFALSMGAYGTSMLTPTAKAIGGDIAKAVPFVGTFISGLSALHDAYEAVKDFNSCMAGVK